MRRLIVIEIDADSIDCGKCKHRSQDWCDVFSVRLKRSTFSEVWGRDRKCKDAEQQARGSS